MSELSKMRMAFWAQPVSGGGALRGESSVCGARPSVHVGAHAVVLAVGIQEDEGLGVPGINCSLSDGAEQGDDVCVMGDIAERHLCRGGQHV